MLSCTRHWSSKVAGFLFCLLLLLPYMVELRFIERHLDCIVPAQIIADLDSLTETEIEHDGKRFVVRCAPRAAASLALRAAGVALPPTVREAAAR